VTSPDSPVAAAFEVSPNHGERRGGPPDMLLLHYTGMPDAPGALQRLCDPGSEVSCHYLVFEDGRAVQLVPEARRAWHAGAASWAGEQDINSRSVGIEIANAGHAGGLPAYPDRQIEAVIELSADICRRHAIRPDRVLGHSDVAPARKEDPGERFPWDRLHAAGIGHWTAPAPLRDEAGPAPGSREPGVEALQRMLSRYGYALSVTGEFDAATMAVVTAFQRHFRQERVDGRADLSTVATLRDLLATRPE
jgi:N-acetylmuramoyl-L-alanine amidase